MNIFNSKEFIVLDIINICQFKLCQSIAKVLNIRVISPNYRLAPEHPYPTPLNDCYFSTIKLIEKLKITDFILSGDSAGGNLAVAVGIKMTQSKNYTPLLIAPVYGSFNMFNFSTSSMKNENFPTLKDPIDGSGHRS